MLSTQVEEAKRAYSVLAPLGFRFIPLKTDKSPEGEIAYVGSMSLEQIINHLHTGKNYGIHVPKDYYVIDVDPECLTTIEPIIFLSYLYYTPNLVQHSFTVRTGRHGFHIYLKGDYRRALDRTGVVNGLQIKGGGKGYVVGPGSIHPDSKLSYSALPDSPNVVKLEPIYQVLDSLLMRAAQGDYSLRETNRYEQALIKQQKRRSATPMSAEELANQKPITGEELAQVLAQIEPRHFGHDRYEEWNNLMLACACATAGEQSALDAFIEWWKTIKTFNEHSRSTKIATVWQSIVEQINAGTKHVASKPLFRILHDGQFNYATAKLSSFVEAKEPKTPAISPVLTKSAKEDKGKTPQLSFGAIDINNILFQAVTWFKYEFGAGIIAVDDSVFLYDDGVFKKTAGSVIASTFSQGVFERPEFQGLLKGQKKNGVIVEVASSIKASAGAFSKAGSRLVGSPTESLFPFQNVVIRSIFSREQNNYLHQQLQISEHKPENLLAYKLDCDYDPDAKCPKFMDMLNLVFNNNPDLVEDFMRFFGYTMQTLRDVPMVVYLKGTGKNGKSVLLKVLEKFLGGASTTMPSAQQLKTDSFSLQRLIGSQAVIDFDKDSTPLPADVLKKLSGFDSLYINVKYASPVEYTNRAVPIFATNSDILFPSTDKGMFRRMIVFPFSTSFADASDTIYGSDSKVTDVAPEPHYEQTLIREADGIALACMLSYMRGMNDFYTKGQYFVGCDEMSETLRQEFSYSDHILGFLHNFAENLEGQAAAVKDIQKKAFYMEYVEYCRTGGEKMLSQRVLIRKLIKTPQYQRFVSSKEGNLTQLNVNVGLILTELNIE